MERICLIEFIVQSLLVKIYSSGAEVDWVVQGAAKV
jgi:hypothetical protein